MNKVFFASIAVLLAIIITATACYSADYSGPMIKLKRGFANIFTFLGEIPYRMNYEFKNLGPAEGLGYGFVEGCSMAIFRLGVGCFEVFSFFMPLPEGYKPIIDDPEYLYCKPAAGKKK
jgi:putative exosortase-associated protein (TIGR04073 family)